MMHIPEQLRTELDFFRRANEHYMIEAGKKTCTVSNASDEMLYMAMSASLAMDYTEDGFFENFHITDKSISGKQELLIDAYAFIETDSSLVRQLHIFQFKLYQHPDKAASPVELLNFATFVNNNFVHPEVLSKPTDNSVINEIKTQYDEFLNGRRGRRIVVFCHYINNANGIFPGNEKEINEIVMGRFQYDRQTNGFTIQVNGLNDILDLATIGKIRISNEFVEMIVDTPSNSFRLEDNTKTSGLGLPKKVIIGMCNINEFIRLQNKYHHNQLYTENVRLYLGDRAAVNKDIIQTITSNDSIWFPYMNNGISIICDKLTIGNVNTTKKIIQLSLENMQIINGCQTVNALYSAKYKEATRDNFRAATILVRVYEISPELTDFKMNVIRATNNQNAVKSYSLMANDPIQIKIADVFKKFDIIYDRKGESKHDTSHHHFISMVTAALAYRAVYQFNARSLRAGLGKSRVFMKGEYEKVFNNDLLSEDGTEQGDTLIGRCAELLIATTILDTVRDLIATFADQYVNRLPIFRKSAYHLSGYLFAFKKDEFDIIKQDICTSYEDGNFAKLRNIDYVLKVKNLVTSSFTDVVEDFENFYNNLENTNKSDIDNLLKDKGFETEYKKRIAEIMNSQS